MLKYLALLRGINVGGNNKIEMIKLKSIFENLSFSSVQTYINSGNVIFETQNEPQGLAEKEVKGLLVEQIQQAIRAEFGFEIQVLIRSQKNILEICKNLPAKFQNDSQQKTDILFLRDDFDSPASLSLIHTNSEVDNLLYLSGCIVWNLQKINYSKSGINKFIGTKIYKNMTARNINTVRKLGEMIV